MTKFPARTTCICLSVFWISVVKTQALINPQLATHPAQLSRSGPGKLSMSSDGNNGNQSGGGGPFSFLTNPYQSRIPDDLKDEIYKAEANTPAAKERGVRVATYATLAFVGVVLAFFSAFITELRNSPLPPGETGDPLTVAGFDWVRSNPITNFLFTNKIGGGICLLGGAGAGLMAEAELDTKRINAENIFQEMERRRDEKNKTRKPGKGKKRRSGKEKKRLGALSEVLIEEPKQVAPAEAKAAVVDDKTATEQQADNDAPDYQDDGLLGKLKGFYDKADAMAASQALLLNKELEDRGLVEKITDETGLKVIGRDEAAKVAEKEQQSENRTEESSK